MEALFRVGLRDKSEVLPEPIFDPEAKTPFTSQVAFR